MQHRLRLFSGAQLSSFTSIKCARKLAQLYRRQNQAANGFDIAKSTLRHCLAAVHILKEGVVSTRRLAWDLAFDEPI